jgi:hypothetical protein
MFCVCLFWCGNPAAQAETAPGAGSGSPGQTGEVQLTYQDYTNLIAGKKIADNIIAKCVNPQGWLEYSEDMEKTWQQFEQKKLKAMQAWAARLPHQKKQPQKILMTKKLPLPIKLLPLCILFPPE